MLAAIASLPSSHPAAGESTRTGFSWLLQPHPVTASLTVARVAQAHGEALNSASGDMGMKFD